MGKQWLMSLVLAVACYTAQDVWDARCDVGCKRGGWEAGVFRAPNKCLCYDIEDAATITGRKVTLHSRKSLGQYEPSAPNDASEWVDPKKASPD